MKFDPIKKLDELVHPHIYKLKMEHEEMQKQTRSERDAELLAMIDGMDVGSTTEWFDLKSEKENRLFKDGYECLRHRIISWLTQPKETK